MTPSKTIRNLGLLYLVVMALILTLGSFVQARSFSLGLMITEVVCILLPALAYLRLTRTPLSSLRLRPVGWPVLLATLPLGVGAWLLDSILDSLFASVFGYSILPSAGAYPVTTFQAVLVFLALAIFPAVCEEVLYRGVVLRELAPGGARFAIVASSLLFAFFHFRLQGLFALLPIAFLLGYAAWRSGSLLTSILIHFVNNAISAGVLIYTTTRPGGLPLTFPVMLAGGIVLLAVGLWLLKRFSPPVEPVPPHRTDIPARETRVKKGTHPRKTAAKQPALTGVLWPLVLAAVVWLVMAGYEWLWQKQPAVLAAGKIAALAALGDANAGHYRYDVANIVGDNVGRVNYQVITLGGQMSMIGSEQVQAFNVKYQGGTWLSQGYSKAWSTQAPVVEGLAESFDWQFKTLDEMYTASSDGKQAKIQFGENPAQSITVAPGSLLNEELLLRCMALPFEQGYVRLADVIQLSPAREQTKIEETRTTVNVLGGEPLQLPSGSFIAWRVKIGPVTTAWYDSQPPHKLLRYQSAGVTYTLR